ncbi:MAG: tetratricopeptide repeat protein [Spirochaetales bacterium]
MRIWFPGILQSFLVIALLLALIGFLSCSSAPPPQKEIFEKRNLASQYMDFGNRYYQDSDFPQALQLYLLARNYYSSVDDTEGIVAAYNAIGKTYLQLAQFEEAYTQFSFALDLARRSGKTPLILLSLNNLSEAYFTRGEYGKAFEHLEASRALVSATAPYRLEDGVFFHNLATALHGLGRQDLAKEALQQSILINTELKNYAELASNHYLSALIFLKEQKLTEALQAAQQALEYDKLREQSMGIAQDLNLLGVLQEQLGNFEEAYSFFVRAYLVFQSLGHRKGMERTWSGLTRVADKMGFPERAKILPTPRE